jgi:hypothetical protein
MDLLLPAAPKDYVKIPHVIKAVAEFVPIIDRVCLITPEAQGYTKLHGLTVDCFSDAEVLPFWFNRMAISWRPNWTTQQIIKLTQNVTDSEYWLTIDADTFFNQPVPMFTDDGKPILYRGLDQFYPPYFSFNYALLGIGKEHEASFLSECTVYKRSFMDELLEAVGGRDGFIQKVIEIINAGKGHPADSEIYAAWILTHHKKHYEIRRLIQSVGGRYGSGEYAGDEVIAEVARCRSIDCQTFSLHSWSDTWK